MAMNILHGLISTIHYVWTFSVKTLCTLTQLNKLASFLWDIGKQESPRCDATKQGLPSGAIFFEFFNYS